VGKASQRTRRQRGLGATAPRQPAAWRRRALLIAAAAAVVALVALAFAPSAPLAPIAPYKDGSPAWSPDSRRLAFYSDRDGNAEIYVMNADGSEVTRLTNHAADEGYPSWSPDGRTITFDSDRDGNFEIYAMDATGSNVRRVTNHPARDVSAAWSPDGSRIAFMSDRDKAFDIYEIPPSNAAPPKKVPGTFSEKVPGTFLGEPAGGRRLTTTGTSWFPAYSPDGSLLAFHVGRDVHVMPAAGGELRRLTTDPANGMYPTWSPDGRRLAFMSWRNGRTEIFTMNADGTNQARLFTVDRGDAIDPRWSPDGKTIAFVHMPDGMNGRAAIVSLVDSDGTNLRARR
jgi:TolB protein